MEDTYRQFTQARSRADERGIAWRMTFAEWWSVWEPHWARRHLDRLCLCRNGDVGGYELGNVHIATAAENSAEWGANRRAATRRKVAEPVEPAGPTWKDQQRSAERAAFMDALRAAGARHGGGHQPD